MKNIIFAGLFLLLTSHSFAQSNTQTINKLLSYANEAQIDSAQFFAALKIFKACEANHELDVSVRVRSDDNEFHDTVLTLFGIICLKSNGTYAADQYIKFAQRNAGSANEEISYIFEKIFEKYPEYTLKRISADKSMLDRIEWGFLNNHYHELTPKNCRTVFYGLNPTIKELYPKYKKQIDYLLATVEIELKS